MGFTHTPSMANFVFARPPKGNAEEIYKKLYEKGVLVRYFSSGRTKEYLRISIGTAEEMAALVNAVADIIKE